MKALTSIIEIPELLISKVIAPVLAKASTPIPCKNSLLPLKPISTRLVLPSKALSQI
jgi:hypothetical protein